MAIDVLLGLQWGDEGKGKIVDYLAPNYDLICRFQGGPNAGHTLIFEDKKFVLHTIPSGIFREGLINMIGNGVVIDPITLKKEIKTVTDEGINVSERLLISKKAHLILPTHRLLDKASEIAKGKSKIGSTLKGIGPTYMDKTGRNGLRVGDIMASDFKARFDKLRDKHLDLLKIYPDFDYHLKEEEELWFDSIESIKALPLVDGEYYINDALQKKKSILAEGAQGSMLDVDYGTYPFVTSSSTMTWGVCSGLGVAPQQIGKVIGISKAYCTRVGSGPFPTELFDADGEKLQKEGHEFGATTGRPRRCGWIDIPQLRYAIMLNGVTDIVFTKLDVLSHFKTVKYAAHYEDKGVISDQLPFDLCEEEVKPLLESQKGWEDDITGIRNFEDLPFDTKAYISKLADLLPTKISYISVGPDRNQLIKM